MLGGRWEEAVRVPVGVVLVLVTRVLGGAWVRSIGELVKVVESMGGVLRGLIVGVPGVMVPYSKALGKLL